jgi:transcriptional regulator with XRE-family HTH domain
MGRRSKQHRPPTITQQVFADNVKILRDRVFDGFEHETARNRALARGAETTLSQIQRIITQQVAPGIDMLEKVARALKVTPADLVTPYFAQKGPAPDGPFPQTQTPPIQPSTPTPSRRPAY